MEEEYDDSEFEMNLEVKTKKIVKEKDNIAKTIVKPVETQTKPE